MTYRVGIDIGSTATKAAVLDGERIAYTLVIPTGYSSVEAAAQVVEDLEAHGYPRGECAFVATGYGRVAVPFAAKTVTEITCHGKGAALLFGNDCTVVDIGGQDTKAIVLKNGKVVKFNMNDKCSAGTGKFIEVMANRLGLSQTQLSDLARKGQPTTISSMCTVFAESEVISLIGSGTPRENICWGIIESVVAKVRPLVPKAADDTYVLTGGLCENDYVVERLANQLQGTVETSALARFAGAIGAALCLPPDVEPSGFEPNDSDKASEGKGASEPIAQKRAEEEPKAAQPNTLVVTFNTTSQALAFERACRKAQAPGRLSPIPRQVSAGCGYAWQAPLTSWDAVVKAANDAGCAYESLHQLAL